MLDSQAPVPGVDPAALAALRRVVDRRTATAAEQARVEGYREGYSDGYVDCATIKETPPPGCG
ncbi:hypothetical protein [Actinoplanes sp. OR16]|uniref:hypothetical protein n=1 Tax=Actinoplanes sp. OR16 TaxID=946334 RepID=UPI000FDBB5B3|nr:hypothetical protein [Actinoplanes sp. OR16]